VPKSIFKHMIKTLKESQLINRAWIPYGRLISEILNQGEFLKALSETSGFTDDMLGTVTGKIINGSTLGNMRLIKQEAITKLETDWKETKVSSNLMEGFPLICKQDPFTYMIIWKASVKKSNWKIFQKRCMVVLSKWLRAGKQRESHFHKLSTLKKLLNNQQREPRRLRKKKLMKEPVLVYKPSRKKLKTLVILRFWVKGLEILRKRHLHHLSMLSFLLLKGQRNQLLGS